MIVFKLTLDPEIKDEPYQRVARYITQRDPFGPEYFAAIRLFDGEFLIGRPRPEEKVLDSTDPSL